MADGSLPGDNDGAYNVAPVNVDKESDEYLAKVKLMRQLKRFWKQQAEEIDRSGTDPSEFKSQQLPLARIKKIMKSDEDVRMISAEAPVIFAKACELFIQEITMRGLHFAEENKRKTLIREDIAGAVHNHELFDFLTDSVPEDPRDERAKKVAEVEWSAAKAEVFEVHDMQGAIPPLLLPADQSVPTMLPMYLQFPPPPPQG